MRVLAVALVLVVVTTTNSLPEKLTRTLKWLAYNLVYALSIHRVVICGLK